MTDVNLDRLLADALRSIGDASDQAALEQVRIELLGKKGTLTAVLRALGSLPPAERATTGAAANRVKAAIEAELGRRAGELEESRLGGLADSEWLDVTAIPASLFTRGHLHPLSLTLREITAIFSHIGYSVALGPLVEDDFHNFQALNIPEGHPARDEWDTFYLQDSDSLLRTHTSPVQIRYMREHAPPIRIIAPGPVFRHEATDAYHESQLRQVEGLCVDEDIRLSDLKGTIEYFPSQSPRSAPRSAAASAAGQVAAVARADGSRSWGRVWFIRRCSEMGASIPTASADLPSAWAWTVSPCCATTWPTSGCSARMTCAS
jgi:phenylalanyl-tRNA synthetase alpha chain